MRNGESGEYIPQSGEATGVVVGAVEVDEAELFAGQLRQLLERGFEYGLDEELTPLFDSLGTLALIDEGVYAASISQLANSTSREVRLGLAESIPVIEERREVPDSIIERLIDDEDSDVSEAATDAYDSITQDSDL